MDKDALTATTIQSRMCDFYKHDRVEKVRTTYISSSFKW